jgi:hypothetical protein
MPRRGKKQSRAKKKKTDPSFLVTKFFSGYQMFTSVRSWQQKNYCSLISRKSIFFTNFWHHYFILYATFHKYSTFSILE